MENHWKALFTFPQQVKIKIKPHGSNTEWLGKNSQAHLNSKRYYSYFLINNGENIYITPRQNECLQLYVNKTAKQIAAIIQLSPRTVESYISQLKKRLNCHSKIELVQLAAKVQRVV